MTENETMKKLIACLLLLTLLLSACSMSQQPAPVPEGAAAEESAAPECPRTHAGAHARAHPGAHPGAHPDPRAALSRRQHP